MKSWQGGLALMLAMVIAGCATEQRRFGLALPCASAGTVKFQHKADLPPDALAAAGGLPMSDVGGPFNAGDVVLDSTPMQRFIDAEQTGCRLIIRYEQGGVGYYHAQIVLQQTAKGWQVARGTTGPYSQLIGKPPGR